LTGTYQSYCLQIEPSARVYALWESENGGLFLCLDIHHRACAGCRTLRRLLFHHDDGGAATALAAIPAALVLEGWSARILANYIILKRK
jgi:hypothetical protein